MHGTLFVIRPTKEKTPAEFDVDSIMDEFDGSHYFDYVAELSDEEKTDAINGFMTYLEKHQQIVNRRKKTFTINLEEFVNSINPFPTQKLERINTLRAFRHFFQGMAYTYPVIDSEGIIQKSFFDYAFDCYADGETFVIDDAFDYHY